MINLLLDEDKRYLSLENTQRKTLVVSLAFSFALLILVLLFFAMKMYLNNRAELLDVQIQEKQVELQGDQLQDFKEAIAQINQNFSQINSAWSKQDKLTPVFEKIYSLTPSAIYFEALSFKDGEIRVGGMARERDALLLFKEQLESEEMFSNIYFAPFSWIQAINPGFAVTFNYIPSVQ